MIKQNITTGSTLSDQLEKHRERIAKKHFRLGGNAGKLGEPKGDVKMDGLIYIRTYQNGWIYSFDKSTVAVYGAIGEKWRDSGARKGALGYPISDEMNFAEGGRVSIFQNGTIYWWPDTGPILLKEVIVNYTGLICFGETDESSDSDEPYVIFGVISPHGTLTKRTNIYNDVDGGEVRHDLLGIYGGKPNGLTISVLLMEHDEGDPKKYEDLVKMAVDKGFEGVKAALPLIPIVGPVLEIIGPPILDAIEPIVSEELNKLLGTADDRIDVETIYISPKQMILLATQSLNSEERGIGFKVATPLLSGGGGSYKVFFSLDPVYP